MNGVFTGAFFSSLFFSLSFSSLFFSLPFSSLFFSLSFSSFHFLLFCFFWLLNFFWLGAALPKYTESPGLLVKVQWVSWHTHSYEGLTAHMSRLRCQFYIWAVARSLEKAVRAREWSNSCQGRPAPAHPAPNWTEKMIVPLHLHLLLHLMHHLA